jgi:TorA maturation chaperone TorD
MAATCAEAVTVEFSETAARTAEEVSQLHAFLAALYREEVDAQMLRALRDPNVTSSLAEAGVALDPWMRDGPEADVLEGLAVEYAALFLGPGGHVSPYQSVYAEDGTGTLWGEQTVAVRRYVEAAGFECRGKHAGIPDHVSVELEFMAALARHEAEAWTRRDRAAAANSLEYQQEFMNDHLGTWVFRFCERVADTAELPFYRNVASFTSEFLQGEREDIPRRLALARPQD